MARTDFSLLVFDSKGLGQELEGVQDAKLKQLKEGGRSSVNIERSGVYWSSRLVSEQGSEGD